MCEEETLDRGNIRRGSEGTGRDEFVVIGLDLLRRRSIYRRSYQVEIDLKFPQQQGRSSSGDPDPLVLDCTKSRSAVRFHSRSSSSSGESSSCGGSSSRTNQREDSVVAGATPVARTAGKRAVAGETPVVKTAGKRAVPGATQAGRTARETTRRAPGGGMLSLAKYQVGGQQRGMWGGQDERMSSL